jgi:hypothetical protein
VGRYEPRGMIRGDDCVIYRKGEMIAGATARGDDCRIYCKGEMIAGSTARGDDCGIYRRR